MACTCSKFWPLVFASISLVVWLGFTICLVVESAVVSESLKHLHDIDSLNTTLQQLPKSFDTYFVSWVQGLIAMFLTLRYLVSFFYLIFTGIYLLDIFSRNKIRMQFITTTCTSVSSIIFLTSAGGALFVNLVLIYFCYGVIHLANDMIETIQNVEELSGQTIPEKDELKSNKASFSIAISRFGAELVFLLLMLLFCCCYLCYWPHVLRKRKNSKQKFVSNINPEDSDDDL